LFCKIRVKGQPGACSSLLRRVQGMVGPLWVLCTQPYCKMRVMKLNVNAMFYVVSMQLRKLWSDWQPVPQMPLDSAPDLNCCLLHQEIQVINCCIARKKRRKAAKESLDSFLKRSSIDNSNPRFSNGEFPGSGMYARDSAGHSVLRLGANCLCENLTLLETGEPIYFPILQVRCFVLLSPPVFIFYDSSFCYF
jgi:hypothetical protein